MGYVADFVTGRSIAEREPAVGVVITQRTTGWPDPVLAAAIDPVHAHGKFSPLSLPLQGFINDHGYFEPKQGQLGLRLLLDMVGFQTWEAFFEKAYTMNKDGGFKLDQQMVGAGIAAMHPETYKTLLKTGRRGQKRPDKPLDAARILIDAQKRWVENHEDRCFMVAILASPPRGNVWTTMEGEEVEVPHCSKGLADGYPWELDASSRRHIQTAYEQAYTAPIENTAELFSLLSDFQNLSQGLSDVGKYFAPGGFMRHDNVNAVIDINLATLNCALKNAAAREYTGVESREERFLENMEAVAKKLAALQATVEIEIAQGRKYLGIDDPDQTENVAPPTPKP